MRHAHSPSTAAVLDPPAEEPGAGETISGDRRGRDTRPGGDSGRRRRTRLGLGGLALGGVLFLVAAVLMDNANFSRHYVTDQLVRQKIRFKPVAELTEKERRSPCLVANAGKLMTTGKQAECYANDFIGLHLQSIGRGRTYAEVSGEHNALRPRLAAARASADPALPALQEQFTALSIQRQSLLEGESVRGMLLTSYGFSVLGDKVTLAANVAYGAAGLVTLLSLAAIVHGLRSRAEA